MSLIDSHGMRRARRPLALVGGLLGAILAGVMVSQYPVLTVIVVIGLLVAEVGLLSLTKAKNFDTRSLIGMLLFLTMLRPLPDVGNPFVVKRLIDLVWLILGLAILLYMMGRSKKPLTMWGGTYWLGAMIISTLISLLVVAFFFSETFVWSDLLELYRGPYYLLILLIASQVRWTDRQLAKYFFRPMVVGIWIVFGISFLHGLGSEARLVIQYIYTPKFSSDLLGRISTGAEIIHLRNAGTFGASNFYAVALAVLIPFLLAGYSAVSDRRVRFLTGLASILAFMFLGITGSRTGLVAGFVSIASYVFWEMWSRRRVYSSEIRTGSKRYVMLFVIVITAMTILVGPKLDRFALTASRVSSLGVMGDEAIEGKLTLGRYYILETLQRSPVTGFGPSKGVDAYLGDNQYSKLFYRYGIVGMVSWLGFWVSIYVAALRMRRGARSATQLALANAVLSVVPAFLVACVGGDFFEATQISTLLLLLIGIAYSSRGDVSQ